MYLNSSHLTIVIVNALQVFCTCTAWHQEWWQENSVFTCSTDMVLPVVGWVHAGPRHEEDSLCVSYYSDATSMKAKVVFPLSLVPRIVQDSSRELRRCAECTKETPFCAFWCPRTDSHIRAVFSLPCFGLCCVSVPRNCSSKQKEAPSEHARGS